MGYYTLKSLKRPFIGFIMRTLRPTSPSWFSLSTQRAGPHAGGAAANPGPKGFWALAWVLCRAFPVGEGQAHPLDRYPKSPKTS